MPQAQQLNGTQQAIAPLNACDPSPMPPRLFQGRNYAHKVLT